METQNSNTQEIWRPYVPYKTNVIVDVSNLGNIRYKGEILQPIRMPDGYKVIIGDKKWFIEKLVAFTYFGAKNSDYKLVHRNGDMSDNCIENLEWRDKHSPIEINPDTVVLEDLPF